MHGSYSAQCFRPAKGVIGKLFSPYLLYVYHCILKCKPRAGVVKPFGLFTGIFLFFTMFSAFANMCLAQMVPHSDLNATATTNLVGNGTSGPYGLKDHFILQNTEVVKKGEVLLNRGEDYHMDYNRGIISFSFVLHPDDTLLIRYQKLNMDLKRRYFHRELVYLDQQHNSAKADFSARPEADRGGRKRWDFLPLRNSSDLVLSGSKTFSLQMGSAQDLTLKQGLWLSAKGKATQNLEISLQVSDQNMPATTEGTTKRLQELDKVQILVRSPNFSGTLGDYNLEPSASDFFSYQKKLKGIRTEATSGEVTASFALASSGGEYYNNTFLGEDNKQGPYQLRGKKGETSLMVLGGTERIWVDGEKMQRGSDNDYTIDYSRGTIQFTPRKLITAHSRIVVDFEYSLEYYERDFYCGSLLSLFFDGKAELKAGGIFERDNRNHPTSFSLSPEDREILSQAGDDRFRASKDGVVFVGEGKGNYDLAYDSLGNSYYEYVGADSGSYQVSFSWVGEEKGRYRYGGGGVFHYVYPGKGNYSPVVLLPLPESHSLLDLNLSFSPVNALKTQIGWAKSQKDENTFSERGDENRWGDAIFFRTIYKDADFNLAKWDFHQLELAGEYRLIEKDFVSFGRMDQVEKEREWDLPEGYNQEGEKVYQLRGSVFPLKSFGLNFDWGKLKTEQNFTSHRRSMGLEIMPTHWISAKGRREKIESKSIDKEGGERNGQWIRDLVVLNNQVKRFSALVSWEQEKRSYQSLSPLVEQEEFNQLRGKLSQGWGSTIKTSSEFLYREDEQLKAEELDRSTSYTWSNQLSVRNYQGMLSSDLQFAHHVKRDRSYSARDQKQNLLVTRFDLYPPSQLLNLKFYHSQNQIHSAQRVDTYLEVEEGRGDYIYQDGEYVPSPEGDLIRLSEWVGEVRRSLELDKSVRLIFSPHKVAKGEGKRGLWSGVGRIFSTDSFINLKGRFADQRAWGHYFLHPFLRLPSEDIFSQSITIRHDLHLLPANRRLNFRLRWERSEDLDMLISDNGREKTKYRQELLSRSQLGSQHSLEFRIGKEEVQNLIGDVPQDLIKGRDIKLQHTRRQLWGLELRTSVEYRKRTERVSEIRAEFFSLSPELSWTPFSESRLNARFEWTHLRALPQERTISYTLGEGKRRGENYDWRLLFDYRLNRLLTSSLIYSGESIPGKEAKHTARVEVKASF
jgi:hypothetical protein